MFVEELGLIDANCVKLLLAGAPQKPASLKHRDVLAARGAAIDEPRYTSVLRALRDLSRLSNSTSGLLVVSLATHGIYLADAGADRLLCCDSSRDLLRETTIDVRSIVSHLESAGAARRLALIDSCRTRVFDEQGRSTAEELAAARERLERFRRDLSAAKGTAVLSATSIGGVSFDDTATQNGVFTGQLLAGLRGAAEPDDRGYITVRSLATWTNDAVRRWIKQNQPGHAADSVGIGKDFSGANPEDIPLAVNMVRARQAARARRNQLAARFANLLAREPPPLEPIRREVNEALDSDPLSTGEKAATDQLDGQLATVERGDRVAADNFVLWWQQRGRVLFRERSERLPDVPPHGWVWFAWRALAVALLAVVLALAVRWIIIANDAPVAQLADGPEPDKPADPHPLPERRVVQAKLDGATIVIVGLDGHDMCEPSPCEVSVRGLGPYTVHVTKKYYEPWQGTFDTLEALQQALDAVQLEPEKSPQQ